MVSELTIMNLNLDQCSTWELDHYFEICLHINSTFGMLLVGTLVHFTTPCFDFQYLSQFTFDADFVAYIGDCNDYYIVKVVAYMLDVAFHVVLDVDMPSQMATSHNILVQSYHYDCITVELDFKIDFAA